MNYTQEGSFDISVGRADISQELIEKFSEQIVSVELDYRRQNELERVLQFHVRDTTDGFVAAFIGALADGRLLDVKLRPAGADAPWYYSLHNAKFASHRFDAGSRDPGFQNFLSHDGTNHNLYHFVVIGYDFYRVERDQSPAT